MAHLATRYSDTADPLPARARDLDAIFRLAGASGPQGRDWIERFLAPNTIACIERSRRAIFALRGGQIDSGAQEIETLHRDMATLDPAVVEIVERALYSARAYLLYRLDQPDQAAASLNQAMASVEQAIARHPFLIGLANHAYDFCLQRARIAGKGRRWDVVKQETDRGRAMVGNREPMCRLPNDSEVFISDVDRFHRSVGVVEEWVTPQEVVEVLDERRRSELFEYGARGNYLALGMVVPIP